METHDSLVDDAESFQTMILSPMDDDISDDEEEDDTSVRLREKTSQILATYKGYLSDIESSTSTTNDHFISKTKIYSSSSKKRSNDDELASSSRWKNDVNLHDIAHLRRYESHGKQQYSFEVRMKAKKHLITLTMCFLSVMCVSAVVSIAKSVRSQRVDTTYRDNEDPLKDTNTRTGMTFSNAATVDVEFDLEQLHEDFLSKQRQGKRHYDETASLYQNIHSKYSPQLFSRESGWSGTTTVEAIEFCNSKMNGVICPYEVYCPEGSHSLPYGGVRTESNAWGFIPQWAATSNNGWVSLSVENSCMLWNALHDGSPLWDTTEGNESETRHLMCCQKTGNHDLLGIDGKKMLEQP